MIHVRYFKDAAGESRVRILGGNFEPMFTSEGYADESSARNAILVIGKAFQEGEVTYDTEAEVGDAIAVTAGDAGDLGDVTQSEEEASDAGE